MHVSGAKEEAIIKRIGLDGVFIEKVRGHVGGIWCLRNPSLWKVQVLDNSHYHVHMRVNWQNTGEWLLIVVYYSPHYQHRQELWDVLRELSLDIDCAWAILGDFNSIIHPHERKGGSANPSNRGILGFSNMINNCDLIDAIFQGYPLTWKRGSLEQRLDMLLINIQWRMKFTEATVFHLPPFKSDHRPLLVRLDSKESSDKHNRPFKFLASWITHEDFHRFVRHHWNPMLNWNSQILSLQKELQRWNKEVFGNIFYKKRRVLRKMEKINLNLSLVEGRLYEEQLLKTWKQYELVIYQEEIMMFQKARSKWLSLGDRNSRFFHDTTIIKRRRSKVEMIQTKEGDWVTDPGNL
ncbi:uncharacterized protein LOC109810102 [Cajanus cajan]|uniref:uncharacterized protein LOC109810102 n=1 Tax=Cajanus cajan TaxID=3821 RepID=UPI00098D8BFA|nr:uncharacterized protein LOC109810102 [Cajanus cajan]